MSPLHVLNVGHTGITVSDIDASIAFFHDVLGFEVSPKVRVSGAVFAALTGVIHAEIDVAFVKTPNHALELLQYVSPPRRPRPEAFRSDDPGFLHVCLKVKDIDRVVSAIGAAGFAAVSSVQTVMEGPAKGLRAVYARNHDGVCLELIEEPPGIVLERLFG